MKFEDEDKRLKMLNAKREQLSRLDHPASNNKIAEVALSQGGSSAISVQRAEEIKKMDRHATLFVSSQAIRKHRTRNQMKVLLTRAWGRPLEAPPTAQERQLRQSSSSGSKGRFSFIHSFGLPSELEDDDVSLPPGCLGVYLELAEACSHIVQHPWFDGTVTVVILIAGALVGIQTDRHIAHDKSAVEVIETLDLCVLCVFIAEMILKTVAEGTEPWRYLYNSWNVFDLVVVTGSVVNLTGAIASSGGSLITMLRLLRLLRVLKLIKRFPQLAIIVNALMMGLSSIGFIGILNMHRLSSALLLSLCDAFV